MPAVRKKRVERVTITKGELAGLVVETRTVSLGAWREMMTGSAGETEAGQADRLINAFAAVLVSWDLTDEDGSPVPATLAELNTLDVKDALMMIREWMDALLDVPDDLGKESPNGSPSLAGSIPMTPMAGP